MEQADISEVSQKPWEVCLSEKIQKVRIVSLQEDNQAIEKCLLSCVSKAVPSQAKVVHSSNPRKKERKTVGYCPRLFFLISFFSPFSSVSNFCGSLLIQCFLILSFLESNSIITNLKSYLQTKWVSLNLHHR